MMEFGDGRGGKDSPEQARMDEEIRSLGRLHQCRVARFGGGGMPSWEIKVVEPDGIRSTLVAGYKPWAKRIELFDDRGRAVAEALRELLQSKFNLADVPIVASRKG
jgi:hypothetical protein